MDKSATGTMVRREWVWATAVSIFTALVLSAPYLLAALTVQDGQFYTQLIMNPEDSQTYWAKMTQGLNGAWAYTIPFTTESHDPAYVGIFYVWLGQLARITGLSLTAVWHLSRLIANVILFLTVYWFIGLFAPHIHNSQFTIHNSQLKSLNPRKLAFLLALFGSGLGWLLFIFQQPYWLDAFPVDFKQPGAHLFFTAMTFPHITIGTACILVSTGMLFKIEKRVGASRSQLAIGNWQSTIIFGFSNLLLGIAYPFLIYLVAGTAVFYTLYLIWQRRAIPWQFGIHTAIGFLIPAPLYLYYIRVLESNTVFKAWDVQAITPSAPWPHYLIAFGPYLWLSWVYWRNRPQERRHTALLFCWILTVILLLYAPLNPQRRFLQGVQVPLSILSALALTQHILPNWIRSRRWQQIVARPRYETPKLARLLLVIFLLVMSLSNIYLWADISRTAVLVQPDPLFRLSDELEAVDWLRENNGAETAVFGTMQTGNLIAAQTGIPVFIGHWAETVDFEQKRPQSEQFFAEETTNAWRQQLLSEHKISHVWIGPREQSFGAFNPEPANFLTLTYQNNTVQIYKVTSSN